MATILVTAATSQFGQAAVEKLLTLVPASSVAVAVRSPSKVPSGWTGVDVREIDYADSADKWADVMKGIERVLLISSTALGDERVSQHTHIIDGAKAAGVKLLAYTSILYGDKSPLPLAVDHIRTEAAIKASGVPYVLLRNGWYTENYLGAKPGWLYMGEHLSVAGDARFSTAPRKDYAEAAAMVIAPTYKGSEEALELAGDESFDYPELAAFVSEKLGKEVKTVEVTPEAWEKILADHGVPKEMAHMLPLIDVLAKDGALYDDSKTLSKILGRPTTSWKETIAAALAE